MCQVACQTAVCQAARQAACQKERRQAPRNGDGASPRPRLWLPARTLLRQLGAVRNSLPELPMAGRRNMQQARVLRLRLARERHRMPYPALNRNLTRRLGRNLGRILTRNLGPLSARRARRLPASPPNGARPLPIGGRADRAPVWNALSAKESRLSRVTPCRTGLGHALQNTMRRASQAAQTAGLSCCPGRPEGRLPGCCCQAAPAARAGGVGGALNVLRRSGCGNAHRTWIVRDDLAVRGVGTPRAKGEPLGKHSGAITQGWQARWQGDEAETKLYLFILI